MINRHRKKSLGVLALAAAIFVTGNVQAQIPDNETHAHESLDSGKGLMPGDISTAHSCKWVEIGGWSAFGVGVAGLAGTKLVHDSLVATVGKVSTADYYVFGGMAVVGLAAVITAKIVTRKREVKPSFGVCSMPSDYVFTVGLTVDL